MQYGMDYNGVSTYEDNTVATSPWVELRCVEAGRGGSGGGDGISALALDIRKEIVWAGTSSGMLHGHVASDLSRVSSVFLGSGDGGAGNVRSIAVSHGAVLCALQRGLAVVSRGGVMVGNMFADITVDARAIALNPLSDGQICMGGASRYLCVVDWENCRVLRQAPLRGASVVTDACWSVPPNISSLCVFGTQTGRISVCNPSTMQEVHAVVGFAGTVTSVSCNGYTIAATGCSPHGGLPYPEQTVKIFDIRQMNTPLPSIPFPAGPTCTAFDAWANEMYCNGTGAVLWGLSPSGVMQCFDCSQQPAYFPLSNELHLDSAQDRFTCMTVSKLGLVVLGDSGGFIHEWAAHEYAQVNANSENVYEKSIHKNPSAQVDAEFSRHVNQIISDDTSATIPRFVYEITPASRGIPLLSDQMFKHLDRMEKKIIENSQKGRLDRNELGRQDRQDHKPSPDGRYESAFARHSWNRISPRISDSILSVVKKQGSVGYAQAPPGFRRNTLDGHDPFPTKHLSSAKSGKPLRRPRRHGVNGSLGIERRANGTTTANGDDSGDEIGDILGFDSDLLTASGRTKYVEMNLMVLENVDGFNFLRYNRSGLFCGLENTLANVYVNAAVQALYFTPPLRHSMLKHTYNRDECITCELGYLFHMMDLAGPAMACEAGNFSKAFSKMANADALGLLDGKMSLPPSQRIENFTRYLLEQLHQDENDSSTSIVSSLLGADCLTSGTYAESGTEWERLSRPFQHTLNYVAAESSSFCELLERSLCRNLDPTRAFCEATGRYEMMASRRRLRTLPNLLLLGCNTKAPDAVRWWDGDQQQNQNVESMRCPSSNEELELVAQTATSKPSKLLRSIYVEIEGENVHVADNRENQSQGGLEFGYDVSGSQVENTGDSTAVYDLAFVVAFVPPSDEEAATASTNSNGHLVAYIRVPEAYKKWKRASGVDSVTHEVTLNDGTATVDQGETWYCFNDFAIAPCNGFEEVAAFDCRWKIPCLISYVRRDISVRMEVFGSKDDENNCNLREVIGSEQSNRAFGLFEDEETPGLGTLFALDCEFVMTAREEAIIYSDGSRRVVNPAKMALGRVSVIRASGPRKGLPIIDDYVAVKEPIVDYLTRFSGLTEGDLNPTLSRFEVKPLKMVYRRLRCLVDAGCIFIGHGLKKDFRIINFVVPPKQVIDTVNLFRISGKRRLLGLRFLTMTLLQGKIQVGTHDSIEDAEAALKLYEYYKRIVGDGSAEKVNGLQKLLHALYAYGYLHNFQADLASPFDVQQHTTTVTGE